MFSSILSLEIGSLIVYLFEVKKKLKNNINHMF
jgi:hypothetical protein